VRFASRFTSSSVARPRSCKVIPTARSGSWSNRSRLAVGEALADVEAGEDGVEELPDV
jgi:hypothetical protein